MTHLDTLERLLSHAHEVRWSPDVACPLASLDHEYARAHIEECTCSVKAEVKWLRATWAILEETAAPA